MPYLGIQPVRSNAKKADVPLPRVGGGTGFNGTATQFYLRVGGQPIYPETEILLTVNLNGGILEPGVQYTVANDIITFSVAPSSNSTFYAVYTDPFSVGVPGSDTVGSNELKNSAVTTVKIAPSAVTSDKIADGTIQSGDIANSAVITSKIAADAVDASKLRSSVATDADRAVTTNHIRDLNITTGKIADLGVTTGKIADLNVTTGKIADLNVTTGKLANNAVDSVKLKSSTTTDGDRAVTTDHIRDFNITTGKLANDAVDATKLKDSPTVDSDRAVTTNHIRNGAVTTEKLPDNSVTSEKLNIKYANEAAAPAIEGKLLYDDSTNLLKIYTNRWESLVTGDRRDVFIGWIIVNSTPYSVDSNKYYLINSTSGPITINLPASPLNGDIILFADANNTWNTNNVTLNAGSNLFKDSLNRTDNTLIFDTDGVIVNIIWSGTHWRIF